MKAIAKKIKECFYEDKINMYSLLILFFISILDYIIWRYLSGKEEFFFYTPYDYFPLEILFVIFVMHVFISYNSYKLNKYISNMLMASVVFYSILILAIEGFYLAQL